MTLKDRIRKTCKDKGLTAQTVERDCGLGNGFISKCDISSPSFANVAKIAQRLDVSLDYLAGIENDRLIDYLNDSTLKRIVLFAGGMPPSAAKERFLEAMAYALEMMGKKYEEEKQDA